MPEEKSFRQRYKEFLWEVDNPTKNSKADVEKYTYTYADMAEVDATIKPMLQKHGLALRQSVSHDEDGWILSTYIFDDTSELIVDSRPLFFGSDATKNGSFETYSRRYAKLTVCGLAPTDDDGNNTRGSVLPNRQIVERINKGIDALKNEGGNPNMVLSQFDGWETDARIADNLLRVLMDEFRKERDREEAEKTVQSQYQGVEVV